jgi:hypothetical protein
VIVAGEYASYVVFGLTMERQSMLMVDLESSANQVAHGPQSIGTRVVSSDNPEPDCL